MIQSRWSQNLLLGLLIVVLAGLVWWGINNGIASARSKRIVKDAIAIKAGFKEFYNDQNRYPTTGEFDNTNLIRPYVTNFPPQEFPTATCSQSFDYFNANPQVYELRFCLPKAVNGYMAGWNTLKP